MYLRYKGIHGFKLILTLANICSQRGSLVGNQLPMPYIVTMSPQAFRGSQIAVTRDSTRYSRKVLYPPADISSDVQGISIRGTNYK